MIIVTIGNNILTMHYFLGKINRFKVIKNINTAQLRRMFLARKPNLLKRTSRSFHGVVVKTKEFNV